MAPRDAPRRGGGPVATSRLRCVVSVRRSVTVLAPFSPWKPKREPMDFRRIGQVTVMVLLVQVALGVAASLWVTIGPGAPWSHLGNVAILVLHGALGVALLLMAPRCRWPGVRAAAWPSESLGNAVVAWRLGRAWLRHRLVATSGAAGYSFGMALGWVAAMFANVRLGPRYAATRCAPGRRQRSGITWPHRYLVTGALQTWSQAGRTALIPSGNDGPHAPQLEYLVGLRFNLKGA